MKTKLIRIGNFRGVRIPKPLLEQSGQEDEFRLSVVDGGIVFKSERATRASRAEAAAEARKKGGDGLLDGPVPTSFDVTEWERE